MVLLALLLVVDADELIHMFRLGADKILQVQHGRSAAVLGQVCRRVLAADIDPAGVQLGLQQACGDLFIEDIQCVLAVQLGKFEIVIMIQQGHTQLVADLAQHGDIFNHFRKSRSAGSVFGRQVRDRDILAADGLVIAQHTLRILDHIQIRYMCRQRDQTQERAHIAHFLGLVPVKTGKFHAVIAQVLQLFQRSEQIGFCVFSDRIDLNRNRKFLHDSLFLSVFRKTAFPPLGRFLPLYYHYKTFPALNQDTNGQIKDKYCDFRF